MPTNNPTASDVDVFFYIEDNWKEPEPHLPESRTSYSFTDIIRSFLSPLKIGFTNIYQSKKYYFFLETFFEQYNFPSMNENTESMKKIAQIVEKVYTLMKGHYDGTFNALAPASNGIYTNIVDEILSTGTVAGHLPLDLSWTPSGPDLSGYIPNTYIQVFNGADILYVEFQAHIYTIGDCTFTVYFDKAAFITRRPKVAYKIFQFSDPDPTLHDIVEVGEMNTFLTNDLFTLMKTGPFKAIENLTVKRMSVDFNMLVDDIFFILHTYINRTLTEEEKIDLVKAYILENIGTDDPYIRYPELFVLDLVTVIPLVGPGSPVVFEDTGTETTTFKELQKTLMGYKMVGAEGNFVREIELSVTPPINISAYLMAPIPFVAFEISSFDIDNNIPNSVPNPNALPVSSRFTGFIVPEALTASSVNELADQTWIDSIVGVSGLEYAETEILYSLFLIGFKAVGLGTMPDLLPGMISKYDIQIIDATPLIGVNPFNSIFNKAFSFVLRGTRWIIPCLNSDLVPAPQ